MKPLALLFLASIVGGEATAAPRARVDADPQWSTLLPPECLQFAAPRDPEHPLYWDLRLSLASCMQDTSIAHVESPFDVGEMVADMTLAIGPSMLIWRDALDHGPPVVQLRAAYQVGLTAVAFMTRARASLVAPAHLSKVDAAERERVLRARLEPLLEPSKRVAWSAFTVIDSVAREVPDFETDPFHRSMVKSARQILPVLEPPGLSEPRQPIRALH